MSRTCSTSRPANPYRLPLLAAAVAAATASTAYAQPLQVTTTRVGQFAGLVGWSSTPITEWIAGTDLGIVTSYGDYQVIHYGDSYFGTGTGDFQPKYDDAVAVFKTAGSSANAVPKTHFLGWANAGPGLDMSGARTPVAAAHFGDDKPWYGLFLRANVVTQCTNDADCNGLVCDPSMGLSLVEADANEEDPPAVSSPVPCWLGSSQREDCGPVEAGASTGLCRDPSSSLATAEGSGPTLWDPVDGEYRSELGKVLSVAWTHQLGQADPAQAAPATLASVIAGNPSQGLGQKNSELKFHTHDFVTNKFTNASMRVHDSTLYIWGRPGFWHEQSSDDGSPIHGAGSEMYLAKATEADLQNLGSSAPAMHYFSGISGGEAQWSDSQLDAAPLPLEDGHWQDGVLQQHSLTFVEGPNKWVLLYGGGMTLLWDVLFGGDIAASLRGNDALGNVKGSIKMRTSDAPWGPWSAPVDVLRRDDPAICDVIYSGCNPLEVGNAWLPNLFQPGALYGSSIVDAWTTWDAQSQQTTIGWLVSTFNPYEVQQMKTVIRGLK